MSRAWHRDGLAAAAAARTVGQAGAAADDDRVMVDSFARARAAGGRRGGGGGGQRVVLHRSGNRWSVERCVTARNGCSDRDRGHRSIALFLLRTTGEERYI